MELKNKAQVFIAEFRKFVLVAAPEILPIDLQFTIKIRIHGAENIQQSGLAASGFPDDRNKLAFTNLKA